MKKLCVYFSIVKRKRARLGYQLRIEHVLKLGKRGGMNENIKHGANAGGAGGNCKHGGLERMSGNCFADLTLEPNLDCLQKHVMRV